MKKFILAAVALAAAPAFATTYNYTGAVKKAFGNNNATFAISVNDSTSMLSATITTVGSDWASGFGLNCCASAGTQQALRFTSSNVTAGTTSYSLDLTNAANFDASFVTANGGTAASAFAALLSTLNNPTGGVAALLTGYPTASTTAITGAITPVPEPATYAMLALGLGLVALRARKQA